MPTEVRPLGVKCNIRCEYCYQNQARDADATRKRYDMDAMKAAILQEKTSFFLFGGEPLLVNEEDLEELWAWGWRTFRKNGIQTNGSLINDRHIEMFQKYHVRVGISIDGPEELNDVRWAGSLEATRKVTARTQAAIARLCGLGMAPSLIVTLHRANATVEKLDRLIAWLIELDAMGIRGTRLHILEVDSPLVRSRYALSREENMHAFMYLAEAEKRFRNLRFDVFDELRMLLQGKDEKATCVWTGCDPCTTPAVRGIEGNGQRSNCGRTNKDGVDFIKAERPSYERYLNLYRTPQSVGGCQGCRYFLMCKGQCPGNAIDGDWRNRSEHCEIWKTLFAFFEQQIFGKKPDSLISDRERAILEREFIARWSRGVNSKMSSLLPLIRKNVSNEAAT